ncbi:HNH endonuclease [Paraburkholderia aspalathi]|uniref:HNH endonuclease n=1 Tax=Paraburkholderia nemoris TaxID=2793076 RepID=UPI00190A3372|nr:MULTISPECIES: HNH endonuclease [Paraburkholderia]MBK3785674.1 HNH endonuclease [Paraburkholderia aspalathi]
MGYLSRHSDAMGHCAICDEEITPLNDSKEHVVPNAVGGRLKVRGFICRKCNNGSGCEWDAELADQFNWFSVTLNVKREAGVAPSHPVKTVGGQGLLLHADGTMSPDKPVISTTEIPSGRQISIKARTRLEARKILKGLQRKYPESDFSMAFASLTEETSMPDGPIMTSFQFGGPLAGRSIVKTAVAMAFRMSIPPAGCELAMRYIKGVAATPPFAEFLSRDLVRIRPDKHVFHVVSVRGDPETKRLMGYVEYFGLGRFLVLLSTEYDGCPVQRTYSINPATAEEIKIAVDLVLSEDEFNRWLANDAVPDGSREAAFNYAMPVILRQMYARADANAFDRAYEEACRDMGIESSEALDNDQIMEFSRRMAHKLMPHLLRILRHRPRV